MTDQQTGTEEAQALTLSWVFGTTATTPNNLVNLSDGRVAYMAANTAIIYDKRSKTETLLQGHVNTITCITSTSDRSTLLTADSGPDSMLVLWSSKAGSPVHSLPSPHKHGIVAMDMSPDNALLATLSAVDPHTEEQEVALWAFNSQGPLTLLISSAVPAGDAQVHIRFNAANPAELITTGKRRVYFWHSQLPDNARFKYYSPPLKAKDFGQAVGDFTMSTFVPGSTQAATGTTDGDLVVWEEQGAGAHMGTRATDRRAIKIVRLHSKPITVLSSVGDYIVTGGKDGFIRFFDRLLRLCGWFEDLSAGGIMGISFTHKRPAAGAGAAGKLGGGGDAGLSRFQVPDFMVSTSQSRLVAVQASMQDAPDAEDRRKKLLLEQVVTAATQALCHPTKSEFIVAAGNGIMQRWDMSTHQCLGTHIYDDRTITAMVYARDGSFLVAGFSTGQMIMAESTTFKQLHSVMHNTKAPITRIACSSAGDFVAAIDANDYLLLYGYVPYKTEMHWGCVGRCKAHHGRVAGMAFGESPAGKTRLFSAGLDNRVVEYDLAKSSVAAGVVVDTFYDMPLGAATLTAISFAPPMPYFKHTATDTLLLLCDDGCKYRLFNPDKAKAEAAEGAQDDPEEQGVARVICEAVYLGPAYGGPTEQLTVFRASGSEDSFLAYSTGSRVVGLVAWPLLGDPAQSMGVIAHPGPIKSVSISFDGRKLLTCGADCTLALWDISTPALHAAIASMDTPAKWESLVGGPQSLEELRDLFLYAQVKAHEINGRLSERVTGKLPVHMVAEVMRAMGFYPSQADILDIMHHIRFMASRRGDGTEAATELTLQDFITLYVNHRPLAPVTQEDISAAFATLGASAATGQLAHSKLQSRLLHAGEPLTEEELGQVLTVLTGSAQLGQQDMRAEEFAARVLGFE